MNVKPIDGGGVSVTLTNLDGEQFEVVTCVEQQPVQLVSREPVLGWFSWEVNNVEHRSNGGGRRGLSGPGRGAAGAEGVS